MALATAANAAAASSQISGSREVWRGSASMAGGGTDVLGMRINVAEGPAWRHILRLDEFEVTFY